MSKPLIATNVPGCRDVLNDGINGFLCEVKNAKDLADKMEKMINLTSDERLAMGKAGREKMIKEFDESKTINDFLANTNFHIFTNIYFYKNTNKEC